MLHLFAGFAFEEQDKVSTASHFVEENPLETRNTAFSFLHSFQLQLIALIGTFKPLSKVSLDSSAS